MRLIFLKSFFRELMEKARFAHAHITNDDVLEDIFELTHLLQTVSNAEDNLDWILESSKPSKTDCNNINYLNSAGQYSSSAESSRL
mmetsp:Transcript_10567/g.22617  ORF Transcript_10567/g.22617 Transcript_10567/m.22617 type:complete len:86 (-) Transcript_10567:37-294(-)